MISMPYDPGGEHGEFARELGVESSTTILAANSEDP